MDIIQAFQLTARTHGFVEMDECGAGTVLWLRKTTPQAGSRTHARMCIDSLTNSATVYWADVWGIGSRTFRSVVALQEGLAALEKLDADAVALGPSGPGGSASAPQISVAQAVGKRSR